MPRDEHAAHLLLQKIELAADRAIGGREGRGRKDFAARVLGVGADDEKRG